ncbi:hypothetical protein CR513_44277, partial [Mucuna pruriens]
MALSKYDIVYTTQKAIKGSVLAEQLAHHPLDDYQSLLHEFPDEHIMAVEGARSESNLAEWKLWFDGASNLLGNRIGATSTAPTIWRNTKHVMGITMAIEHQVKTFRVFDDSALVIYQLCEEWETHDTKLIPYHNYVMEMSEQFDKITFHYIP